MRTISLAMLFFVQGESQVLRYLKMTRRGQLLTSANVSYGGHWSIATGRSRLWIQPIAAGRVRQQPAEAVYKRF